MLKDKRKEKKISQSKLAKKLGISESYLSKLEKHPSLCNPSVNLILKLSEELTLDPVKVFLYFIKEKAISIYCN